MATKTRPRSAAPTTSNFAIIKAAAARWKVPEWILYGVKVAETGTGSGIGATSSTGAQGPFQFEPATAASYHVNVSSFSSSANGAAHYLHDLFHEHGSWDAALQAYSGGGYGEAHVKEKAREGGANPNFGSSSGAGSSQLSKRFIAELFQLGWNAVSIAKIEQTLTAHGRSAASFEAAVGGKKSAASVSKAVEEIEKSPIEAAAEAVAGAASNPLAAVGSFFSALTKGETWLRLAEVLAGAILLIMGLKALTGSDLSDLPGTGVARKLAPIPPTF